MSESPYGLIWRHGTRPFGTLGSPRQHPTLGTVNEARVIDDDGRDLDAGETGELLLRNPAVTPGYWEMPEETAAAVVDGWLHTGDLVTVNADGTYTFVSRKKEVLRRRGQNLSPAEVEDAILAHPDVLEVAVVGVPSELTEEEVKAFVVPAPAGVWTSQSSGSGRPAGSRPSRFRGSGRPSTPCRAPRPPGSPSTGCRPVTHPTSTTPRTAVRSYRDQGRRHDAVTRRRSATPTSRPSRLLGHDLAGDLMGEVGFAELAFWLVAMRRPTSGELRVFEAVLVALADHGFTPSAIAARLTLTGAPESVQGAMAAGLLGGGSRFLGVTEDDGSLPRRRRWSATARRAASCPTATTAGTCWRASVVRAQVAAGRYVPGLGHNVHKRADPRTSVLLRIAAEEGRLGPHLRLFEAIGRVHPELLGRTLPLNGAGVCGAALCDLGFPVEILRGFALLARAAGLLGHIAEEMRRPVGMDIYQEVDRATEYEPPNPAAEPEYG